MKIWKKFIECFIVILSLCCSSIFSTAQAHVIFSHDDYQRCDYLHPLYENYDKDDPLWAYKLKPHDLITSNGLTVRPPETWCLVDRVDTLEDAIAVAGLELWQMGIGLLQEVYNPDILCSIPFSINHELNQCYNCTEEERKAVEKEKRENQICYLKYRLFYLPSDGRPGVNMSIKAYMEYKMKSKRQ